jgi:hypothetical protein
MRAEGLAVQAGALRAIPGLGGGVQGDEEPHEALDGIALQFVVEQGGDFWLADAERRRDFGLREALLFDDAAEGGSETGFGVEFGCVGEFEVGEDVAGGGGDFLFSHFFPRSPGEQLSGARG